MLGECSALASRLSVKFADNYICILYPHGQAYTMPLSRSRLASSHGHLCIGIAEDLVLANARYSRCVGVAASLSASLRTYDTVKPGTTLIAPRQDSKNAYVSTSADTFFHRLWQRSSRQVTQDGRYDSLLTAVHWLHEARKQLLAYRSEPPYAARHTDHRRAHTGSAKL